MFGCNKSKAAEVLVGLAYQSVEDIEGRIDSPARI
jgi:hypothetical protein